MFARSVLNKTSANIQVSSNKMKSNVLPWIHYRIQSADLLQYLPLSRTHAKNSHAIAVLYKYSRTPIEYKIKDTIFPLNIS